MLIIPAVDIKQGRCVRLLQGRMDAETCFSDEPWKMALQWEKQGAELIHLVDLDGAVGKEVRNLESIKQIIEKINVPVQVGGGIRSSESVRMYLDLGVSRVIIGSEAVYNPDFVKDLCKEFPERIVVAIDARDGLVAVEGWTEVSEIRAVDLARKFEHTGVAAINFTDIYRDGMQTGPNLQETERLAEAVDIPIVASGGVSSIQDIKNLLPLEKKGVVGVITGRALYENSLDLQEAIKISKSC